jgi:hypothetical protein
MHQIVWLSLKGSRSEKKDEIQPDGVNMKNLLAPIFRLIKRDPLPFIPVRSITSSIQAQQVSQTQLDKSFFPRQTHRSADSSEHSNQLSS